MTVVHAKLIVIQNDTNGYIYYIFENLGEYTWKTRYFMCARYPNWETKFPQIGDVGYLVYTEVHAGDEYIDKHTGEKKLYAQSHLRFEKFLDEPQEKDNKYVM